ncbi:hypothetical protein FRC08_000170 [Ceratobasidium sp. 394]|nr:hypothetical protein FRC08_000170 [Ceratobasidium sp. 394]
MHSLNGCKLSALIYLSCWPLISCTSLSLAYGNRYFNTFSGFSTQPIQETQQHLTRGLLPPSIEKAVLTLLLILAQWHGLTKLRRHTSASVAALRHVTTRLGHEVREFHRYTSELEVYETTRDHAARQQRVRKKARPRAALAADSEAADPTTSAPELGRRRKYFNIETTKFHVLGDHPESIEEEDLSTHDAGRSPYQIAESQKTPIIIPTGLEPHGPDPAIKDFLPRLKAHLLAHIRGDRYEDEQTRTTLELAQIHFQHERIYAHQTLKFHYTTYDVRRAQNTTNPTASNRFILVPSDRLDSAEFNRKEEGIPVDSMVSSYDRRARRLGGLPARPDLIARFAGNQTREYLESVNSVAADTRSVGDWKHYYIGRFADRDLLMRFTGMAIGHMTHANAPAITIGVTAETLGTGYEYDDGLEQQLDDESEGESGVDEAENVEDESDGEDESESEQTDHSEYDSGLEEDGDGEDVSW